MTLENVTLQEVQKLFPRWKIPEDSEQSADQYLEWLSGTVLAREMHLSSPTMAGHMTTTLPPYIAPMSALITSANLNVVKVETAKAMTFLERETVAMLHNEIFDRQEGFYQQHSQARNSCLGIFASGGTVCNLQALFMARSKVFPEASEDGFPGGGVVLGSELMHYSIEKACTVLGFGRRGVRKIPVDGAFRIDIELLRVELGKCRAEGVRVVAIVGVLGTTETGSIDDLASMARLAKEYGCHFHVDAAWGGALALARKLPGLADADTITVDAHKQLQCPVCIPKVLLLCLSIFTCIIL